MSSLFGVKDYDRRFYRERLANFLPDRLIDIHTHVWLRGFQAEHNADAQRTVGWPSLVARENPLEDLDETYRLMFPGKHVIPLMFGMTLQPGDDLDGGNTYVRDCSAARKWPALIFSVPQWSAQEFETRVRAGAFLGAKVYLSWADPNIPADDIQIFDFLPHHQLEVLNQHGWIAMLHIPRSGRLKDPVNVSQMIEIDRRYPRVKLIIAHVGRAYCPEDVGDSLDVLGGTDNLVFDISANTNAENFERLVRAVGPRRVLFGSDLPISRMRTRRVCESAVYINLVPKGLYGDVSRHKNLREVIGTEAERLTFFIYEEIEAFKVAAEKTSLTPSDLEDVFYNNGMRLLRAAGAPSSIFEHRDTTGTVIDDRPGLPVL